MTYQDNCTLPKEILEQIAEQGLDYLPEMIRMTVFAFPEVQRRKLRTNNSLERLNRKIGRCSKVVGIFPNDAACLRLISAILMEQDEAWQTGRVYLAIENE